jgi:hypothetical protein
MVVAVLWQNHWLILDNLTLILVPDTLSNYTPLVVLDDRGVQGYSPDDGQLNQKGFRAASTHQLHGPAR